MNRGCPCAFCGVRSADRSLLTNRPAGQCVCGWYGSACVEATGQTVARLYPFSFDPYTKSSAERRLHEAFARDLNGEWRVFHHVKWIGYDDLGRPCDGEVDFVVAYPRLGILVIEVKGGRVQFDESTGLYISTGRNGVNHDIGDPLVQATTSKHALIAGTRSMPGWPRRRVVFGHMVASPDLVVEADRLRSNVPREIVIGAF